MSELLTVKEVPQLLKISRVQVRKMILCGELPAVKAGREHRIPLENLREYAKLALTEAI